jgi:hypothetical protein
MVMARLEEVADHIKEVVRTEVAAAYRELQDQLPPPAAAVATATAPSLNLNRGNAGSLYPVYSYVDPNAKGRKVGKKQVFDVPLDFQFPTPCLKNAWIQWFSGLADNMSEKEDGSGRYSAPVKPFRCIEPKMLPYETRRHFNDCWRPILDYMENAVKEDGLVALSSRDPSSKS